MPPHKDNRRGTHEDDEEGTDDDESERASTPVQEDGDAHQPLTAHTVWFQKGAFPATFSVEIATMARFSQSLSVASPWGKPRVPHCRDAHPG